MCVSGDLFNDLFQYVVLCLMEMPEDKLIRLGESGGLRMYVARIIYINAKSPSSQFQRQINSCGDDIDKYIVSQLIDDVEGFDYDEWLNKFDVELKKECNECIVKGVYPAQVKLYELYEEKRSYTKVAACTQIPYKTVQRNIKALREKIINKIK